MHASFPSISISHAFSVRLSLREGTFYRIRNSTVRVQPIIWFIPEETCVCVCMYVCRDGEGEAGRGEKERRGLATVCTIGLESLSFPIAPLNLFFFPFSSLLRASSHSSRVLSLSFLLSCVLSTSTLHHFPRSFLSCNLCLGGARCSIYVYVLADSSLSFLSCFLYALLFILYFSWSSARLRSLFTKCGSVDVSLSLILSSSFLLPGCLAGSFITRRSRV